MRSRKRRNPDLEDAFGPVFEHTFQRGGGSVELYDDGEVVVTDAFDNVQDNYFVEKSKLSVFKALVLDAPFPQWHHYTRDMVSDDVPVAKQARVKRKKARNPVFCNPRRSRPSPSHCRALARIIRR